MYQRQKIHTKLYYKLHTLVHTWGPLVMRISMSLSTRPLNPGSASMIASSCDVIMCLFCNMCSILVTSRTSWYSVRLVSKQHRSRNGIAVNSTEIVYKQRQSKLELQIRLTREQNTHLRLSINISSYFPNSKPKKRQNYRQKYAVHCEKLRLFHPAWQSRHTKLQPSSSLRYLRLM